MQDVRIQAESKQDLRSPSFQDADDQNQNIMSIAKGGGEYAALLCVGLFEKIDWLRFGRQLAVAYLRSHAKLCVQLCAHEPVLQR